jgi:hypothetical protein
MISGEQTCFPAKKHVCWWKNMFVGEQTCLLAGNHDFWKPPKKFPCRFTPFYGVDGKRERDMKTKTGRSDLNRNIK